MCCYKKLCDEKVVNGNWPEDKITRELSFRIQSFAQKNQLNAVPIHQYPIFPEKPKQGKPPTIDFVFRKGYEESPYLAFECKIVSCNDEGSIKQYIDEGINRFISGKYARNEKVAGMIGYLLDCEILPCMLKINSRIRDTLSSDDCLVKSSIIMDFEGIYESNHKRPFLGTLLIYHLFMKFTC